MFAHKNLKQWNIFFPNDTNYILQKFKYSWMQNERYKHEYFDSGQIWVTITGGEEENYESDKQL